MHYLNNQVLETELIGSEYLNRVHDRSLTCEEEIEAGSDFRERALSPLFDLKINTVYVCISNDMTRIEGTLIEKTRRLIYGGMYMDTVIENIFKGALLPGQIYEVCFPEGEAKRVLIENLPNGYNSSIVICDRFFKNMRMMAEFVEQTASLPLNIFIVDISELSQVDYSKDADQLIVDLSLFYKALDVLSQRGVICVVFVNFTHYHQIYENLPRPETVQIHVGPSNIREYWEAKITSPPDLKGKKELFNPFADQIPFVHQP